jgi:hypothetical protein
MTSKVGFLVAVGLVVGAAMGITAGLLGGTHVAGTTSTPPKCRGSELAGAYVRSGAGLGNLGVVVAVTNVASTACRLEGYPILRGLRGGRWHALRASHGTYFGNLSPALLQPREGGALLLGTSDGCQALNQPSPRKVRQAAVANTYAELTVTLPDHRGAFHITGLRIDVACGLAESQVGWRTGFTYLI